VKREKGKQSTFLIETIIKLNHETKSDLIGPFKVKEPKVE